MSMNKLVCNQTISDNWFSVTCICVNSKELIDQSDLRISHFVMRNNETCTKNIICSNPSIA